MQGIVEALALHLAHQFDEFFHILELAVDGYVADVGHGIDALQLLDDFHADDG